jgi:ubiquitin carboxyl-terminal hydrolase 25/28
LDDHEIQLLRNPELLKRRYDALLQDDPERDGIKLATPMDALSRLRRYIKDSLLPQHSKRQIPANNKRFQEAYGVNGEDCGELLERLGFKYAVRFKCMNITSWNGD